MADGRLPELAVHYEERLGGYSRYEDIPDGSEYAKRWSKSTILVKLMSQENMSDVRNGNGY